MEIEKLKSAGIDYDQGLYRLCGNKELYEKLLKYFKDDQSFQDLEKSLEEKRFKDAFMAAHTMKGLVGNLSMNSLLIVTSELVEMLRYEKYDGVMEQFEKVKEAYHLVCDVIE